MDRRFGFGSLIAEIFILIGCVPSADRNSRGDFVIHNLGIRFGSYDSATERAGDFLFHASESKVFLEFGAIVGDGMGGTKELPTFEYRVAKDTWVTAIAEGTVARFVYQSDTQDYEFSVRSDEDPDWEVGYDHVKEPAVAMGDRVVPGDVLGKVGTWSATLGRFEIMINNYATGLSYCPFCCFLPESTAVYQNRVRLLIIQWEAFKHDTTVYDDHLHPYPGCRMESMVSY